MGHYQSENEIDAIVVGFEACTTGVDDFSHRGHLTVAVCYLRDSSREEAFQRICAGLLRFLDHHGVGRAKYDEQLTMKWINVIQDAIEQIDPSLSRLQVTNIVIDRFERVQSPLRGL